MATEKIVVTIPKDGGPVRVEAEGYEGQVCSLDVDEVARAVGGERVAEEEKPEFYRQAKVLEGRERA